MLVKGAPDIKPKQNKARLTARILMRPRYISQVTSERMGGGGVQSAYNKPKN